MRLILLLCTCLFSLSSFAETIGYAEEIIINSKSFESERSIKVSLPASYDSSADTLYPVIYVIRGQLDLLATVASLNMLDKEVPEFIVVGVDGTLGDFFPNKDGSKTQFSRFLHDEVMTYIEQAYRTAPYRVQTAHSMAAIFSINDWLDDGKSFSKYIVISPPLEGGQMYKQLKSKSTEQLKNKSPLLITVSDETEVSKNMFDKLKEIPALSSSTTFKYFPEQTHMSGRVNATMHGLRQEFPGWEPSMDAQNGVLADLRQHYDMLSERYGFKAVIPLDMLARMSGFGSLSDDAKKNENAAAVVEYVLTRNSSDADELFDTANQVASLGSAEGNKRMVSYICKEIPHDDRCEGN